MADDSIDNNNNGDEVETSIAATSLVALEEESQQPPPPKRRRDLLSMLRHIEFVYYFLTPHELARCTQTKKKMRRETEAAAEAILKSLFHSLDFSLWIIPEQQQQHSRPFFVRQLRDFIQLLQRPCVMMLGGYLGGGTSTNRVDMVDVRGDSEKVLPRTSLNVFSYFESMFGGGKEKVEHGEQRSSKRAFDTTTRSLSRNAA